MVRRTDTQEPSSGSQKDKRAVGRYVVSINRDFSYVTKVRGSQHIRVEECSIKLFLILLVFLSFLLIL